MDDDDFLYGGSPAPAPAAQSTTPSASTTPITPVALTAPQPVYSGSADDLYDEPPGFSTSEVAPSLAPVPAAPVEPAIAPASAPTPAAAHVVVPVVASTPPIANVTPQPEEGARSEDPEEGQQEEGEEEEEEEDSEDDIEFIMEPASRSLDLRPNRPAARSQSFTPQKSAPGPSLTTEYTPRERNGLTKPPPAVSTPTPSRQLTVSIPSQDKPSADEGPDPSTLPAVTAPASHPHIDIAAAGVVDGRPVFEVDIANLSDKSWRRPGADLSDWFNYGFDEISWEAYCFRRREMGEAATVLKTNVLNFAGMPEEQLTQLPPDVRAMVMAGTNAMMNGGGGGPQMMQGMMGPGNIEMTGMNGMGLDMQNMQNMQNIQSMPMMNPMMVGMEGAEQVDPTNFGGMPGPSEFGMQDPSAMQQQMFQSMEPAQPQAPTLVPANVQGQQQLPQNTVAVPPQGPGQVQIPGQGLRGVAPGQFRGRGAGAIRGARGFPGRGRGAPNVPPRAASPLPPNVPTGPRNQNKYKDRDNNAQAVEGLDYGGGERGSRTPTETHEDRSSRKRRDRSPAEPDRSERRDSKRR